MLCEETLLAGSSAAPQLLARLWQGSGKQILPVSASTALYPQEGTQELHHLPRKTSALRVSTPPSSLLPRETLPITEHYSHIPDNAHSMNPAIPSKAQPSCREWSNLSALGTAVGPSYLTKGVLLWFSALKVRYLSLAHIRGL